MRFVNCSEVSEQLRGVSYKKGDVSEVPFENSIPVLRAGNIEDDSGILNFDDLYYLSKDAVKDYQIMREGDIVIAASSGSIDVVGKAALMNTNKEATFGAFCKTIRPNKNKIDSNYLFYFFRSKRYRRKIRELAQGANINNIRNEHIDDLKIPLPSLEEQKTIVAKLDRAQRLIDIDKAMLAKYDQLIQSVFLDMFGDPVTNPKGWEVKKLGELCGVGSSKRVFVKELVDDGIPFYRGTEVGKLGEGLEIDPQLFITKEHYQNLKAHTGVPVVGDLLMPSICPDGRIFMVENNAPFYFKDGRVLWVKAGQSDVNSFYLRYHLKALFKANYHEIASGTTFAELKIFALKELDMLLPPNSIQKEFQLRIEKIDDEIEKTKHSYIESEALFSSLVQEVFG